MRRHRAMAALVVGLLAFAVATSPAVRAQASNPFLGDWKGAIGFSGQEVEIVLHFALDADGTVVGTVDAQAQGLKGLPLGDLAIGGNTIAFALTRGTSKSSFSGTLDGTGRTIAGTMSRDGMGATFSVTRT